MRTRQKRRSAKIWVSLALLIFVCAWGVYRFTQRSEELQGDTGERNNLTQDEAYMQMQAIEANLREENDLLRAEIEVTTQVSSETVSAEVVGRETLLPKSTIIINKGSRDGLQTGWVVTSRGFVVGVIQKVGRELSWVQLLSHPTSKHRVQIAGKPESLGVLEGGGQSFGLSISLIPQSVPINKDDVVISTDLKNNGTENSGIGIVTDVQPDDVGLFQRVSVTAAIDYDTIRFVTIIVPAGTSSL